MSRATRTLARLLMTAALALFISAPVWASHKPSHDPPGQKNKSQSKSQGKNQSKGFSDPRHEGPGKGKGHHTGNRGNSGHPAWGHVPELDPGMAGKAAVLLVGGTLVLLGRRRVEPQV